MDKIERAISEKYGLRLIYTDVTETARTLEERHLSGPASAELLGHGLIAASMLSSKIKNPTERISFQLKVDGPAKGVMTEVTSDGGLRGYTDIKVIEELDEKDGIEPLEILGSHGLLTIIHSNDKGVIYSGQIKCENPDVRTAVAKYFNQSEQIPTGVEFYASMKDFHIGSMKGLMIQKMPGADTEKFVQILELFHKNEIKEKLKGSSGIAGLKDILDMDDLTILEEKELQFSCGCSYEKSVNIMKTLQIYELQEIIRNKERQRVACHFCGETYLIKEDDISGILLNMADSKRPV
jgi:molecular chaperone Hsp33